jgi:hypothetical protein
VLMSSLTAFMQCVHVARTNTNYRCDIERVANEIRKPIRARQGRRPRLKPSLLPRPSDPNRTVTMARKSKNSESAVATPRRNPPHSHETVETPPVAGVDLEAISPEDLKYARAIQ